MAANQATRQQRQASGSTAASGSCRDPAVAAENAARQPFFAARQPFSANRGTSPYYTLGASLAPGPRGVIGTGEGHCFFFSGLATDSVILAFRTADLAISAPVRAAGTVGTGERRPTNPAGTLPWQPKLLPGSGNCCQAAVFRCRAAVFGQPRHLPLLYPRAIPGPRTPGGDWYRRGALFFFFPGWA